MMTENLEGFLNKAGKGMMNGLNSEAGQQLVKALLEMKLEENPNMSAEEWNKTKQEFMVFCFVKTIKANPELMSELATHTYNELRK